MISKVSLASMTVKRGSLYLTRSKNFYHTTQSAQQAAALTNEKLMQAISEGQLKAVHTAFDSGTAVNCRFREVTMHYVNQHRQLTVYMST